MSPTLLAWALGSELTLTRRRFLGLLGISAAALQLGCDGRDNAGARATGAADDPPFSVWRQIRDAVRTSPDHLSARAARLVEARDAQAIFAFVRDEIVTYPTRAEGIGNRSGNAVAMMRWGVRGTLRCGAGTPREKAELLATLLRAVGFEAEVMSGRVDPAIDPRPILFRPVTRAFAPQISREQVDGWLRDMGAGSPRPLPVLDENARVSGPLGDRILAALPADAVAPPFDFSLTRVPLVRVVIDGAEQYANPLVPDAAFGDARADQLGRAPRPAEPRPLEVAVQVASTDDPSKRVTVVEGEWPLEQVVGRRIVLQFVPTGELEAALQVPATQIRAFTPVLALDDVHAPREALIERAVVGSTVTVGGDVLDVDEAGRLRFNGEAAGADDEAAAARVASLDVEAVATGFPVVRLRISARDAAGQPVSGLPAGAFTIREGGVALPFLVRQSRPPRPKLLLLFDLSGSLPADFRGRGASALARRLAEEVLARYPDASVQVASVVAGSANGERRWLNDPAAIETATGRLTSWGSELWSALASTRGFGANVVALISDGKSTDREEQLAAAREHVASGPPVIGIAVGDVRREALDEIAALTDGAVFEVQDHQQTVEAITRQLAARDQRPIVIEYEAPRAGPGRRTVEVQVADVAGTASYQVPPATERLATPAIAGIYLVVRRGGREGVRTLAGVPVDRASPREPVDQAMRDEVRAALFGTTLLSVEAGAPTLSAWLDDMLTARLTWGPLWDAAQRNDADALARAMEVGIRTVPSHTLLLHPPLEQSEGALTFETDPRLLLLSERPAYDGGVIRTADLLSLSGWATAAPDPREAFRLTVRRTARLAVAESELYADSTSARLEGRPQEYIAPIGTVARDSPAAPWMKVLGNYGGRHRVVPAASGPFAFWAVDRAGALLGVLPDGSGGGKTKDANQNCKTISQGAAISKLGLGHLGLPFAYGAVILLAKAIAKQYLRAAAIVAALGEDMPDTSGCGGLDDFPCDLMKDGLSEVLPGYKPVAFIDDLGEAINGAGPIKCPWQ